MKQKWLFHDIPNLLDKISIFLPISRYFTAEILRSTLSHKALFCFVSRGGLFICWAGALLGSIFWSNHIAAWYLFGNGKYSYQGWCLGTSSSPLSPPHPCLSAPCAFLLPCTLLWEFFAERCLSLPASLRILCAGWVCIVWCFPLHLLQTNLVSAICLLLYSVFMPWYAFLIRCASVLSLLVNTFVW